MQVPLGELVRLAFPPGTPLPAASFRERPVKWMVMAGAGVMPEAENEFHPKARSRPGNKEELRASC
jgi:hypothetical protein